MCQRVTGGGGSKLDKNSVTYFMDGPFAVVHVYTISIKDTIRVIRYQRVLPAQRE